MRDLFAELWYFFVANLRASYFGVFLLLILSFALVSIIYKDRLQGKRDIPV